MSVTDLRHVCLRSEVCSEGDWKKIAPKEFKTTRETENWIIDNLTKTGSVMSIKGVTEEPQVFTDIITGKSKIIPEGAIHAYSTDSKSDCWYVPTYLGTKDICELDLKRLKEKNVSYVRGEGKIDFFRNGDKFETFVIDHFAPEVTDRDLADMVFFYQHEAGCTVEDIHDHIMSEARANINTGKSLNDVMVEYSERTGVDIMKTDGFKPAIITKAEQDGRILFSNDHTIQQVRESALKEIQPVSEDVKDFEGDVLPGAVSRSKVRQLIEGAPEADDQIKPIEERTKSLPKPGSKEYNELMRSDRARELSSQIADARKVDTKFLDDMPDFDG